MRGCRDIAFCGADFQFILKFMGGEKPKAIFANGPQMKVSPGHPRSLQRVIVGCVYENALPRSSLSLIAQISVATFTEEFKVRITSIEGRVGELI